jgi:CHAT domain-containing protein
LKDAAGMAQKFEAAEVVSINLKLIPLLSCALAFAGWNYLPPGSDASLPGMMTGAEVLGIDLRGTELVVLASCAAGREELTYGQSPANLRHAFHLAGARAVVSALWGDR